MLSRSILAFSRSAGANRAFSTGGATNTGEQFIQQATNITLIAQYVYVVLYSWGVGSEGQLGHAKFEMVSSL